MAFYSPFKHRCKGLLGYLNDRSIVTGQRREDNFLAQTLASAHTLQWTDLVGHYGCVNAVEFSHGLGTYIASGGDDRRVLVWNLEKALTGIGKPAVMKGEHNSNIFCISFDLNNQTIFSGGNDEQVIVHDVATGDTKDVFSHEDAVYGVSPDPTNPSVFATACDDGRVLIYDTRDSRADPFCLANYTCSMHSVMYNPVEPRLLATANAKEGVGLWDVRKPRSCLLRYGGSLHQQSCMSVRFNQHGDQLIALRRRLPPVLYRLHSIEPVCEFDHSGYYNSCTMKSITYAGDNDQYVLSGSDEFNLYMWAVPEDLSERSYINSAHMVLKGHRSIVNQVRFNMANHMIISSGVEKIIKVWSPFPLPSKRPVTRVDDESGERRVYSHEEYINLVLQDGQVMSHDYSHGSTEEDPRMMAFFDSLVQRELDGWSSDDSFVSSSEEALYSRIVQLSQSDIDTDDSIPDIGTGVIMNTDNDPSHSSFTIAFASVMASQEVEGNDRFPRLSRALEGAERDYANYTNISSADSESDTSDDDSRTNDGLITVQDGRRDSVERQSAGPRPTEEGSEKNNLLNELVRKKKHDMKATLRKRMQDLRVRRWNVAASDTTCSDVSDDSDHSSVSSLNIQIGEQTDAQMDAQTTSVVVKAPVAEAQNDKSSTSVSGKSGNGGGAKIEAQKKLKKLNCLRKRVLNNESDNNNDSENEIGRKSVKDYVSGDRNSSDVNSEGKVQFKKFKRRPLEVNTCSIDSSKDKNKRLGSPDLGPFIKKSGIEARQSSAEDGKMGKRNPDDTTLSYSRGKHKLAAKSSETDTNGGDHKVTAKSSETDTNSGDKLPKGDKHEEYASSDNEARPSQNQSKHRGKSNKQSSGKGSHQDRHESRGHESHRHESHASESHGNESHGKESHDHESHRKHSSKHHSKSNHRHKSESKMHVDNDEERYKYYKTGEHKHGDVKPSTKHTDSKTKHSGREKSGGRSKDNRPVLHKGKARGHTDFVGDSKYEDLSDYDSYEKTEDKAGKEMHKGKTESACTTGSHRDNAYKKSQKKDNENDERGRRESIRLSKNGKNDEEKSSATGSRGKVGDVPVPSCSYTEDTSHRDSTTSRKHGKHRSRSSHSESSKSSKRRNKGACSENENDRVIKENTSRKYFKHCLRRTSDTNAKESRSERPCEGQCQQPCNSSKTKQDGVESSSKHRHEDRGGKGHRRRSDTSDVRSDDQRRHHRHSSSSSEEEDQPTWLEFKRFKNRLERARKRYKDEHPRKHTDTDSSSEN